MPSSPLGVYKPLMEPPFGLHLALRVLMIGYEVLIDRLNGTPLLSVYRIMKTTTMAHYSRKLVQNWTGRTDSFSQLELYRAHTPHAHCAIHRSAFVAAWFMQRYQGLIDLVSHWLYISQNTTRLELSLHQI